MAIPVIIITEAHEVIGVTDALRRAGYGFPFVTIFDTPEEVLGQYEGKFGSRDMDEVGEAFDKARVETLRPVAVVVELDWSDEHEWVDADVFEDASQGGPVWFVCPGFDL